MMKVDIGGRSVECKPSSIIGQGGEAVVYDIGKGMAFKLYKLPSHPDFVSDPVGKQIAREKLDEHQMKLPALIKACAGISGRIVAPAELGMRDGRVVGYTMPLLSGSTITMITEYGSPSFRNVGTIGDDTVVSIFRDLHSSVKGAHDLKFVIGDFNDLNILVVNDAEANMIDVDSWQFAKFLCKMYTTRFVDPLLCDPSLTTPELIKPYNQEADWYAYAIMLFQGLLMIDPFGGVYKPSDKSRVIPHDARRLHGITVFDPEVKVPKHALPFRVLPDEVLHRFHEMFSDKHVRGEFPVNLIEDIRWTSCTNCGMMHARHVCPGCAVAAPAVKEVKLGKVTARKVFYTPGRILYATHQDGNLLWLHGENGGFHREDGRTVCDGMPDPKMRFRLSGKRTILAKGGMALSFAEDGTMTRFIVDKVGDLPIIDANGNNMFWIEDGYLYRDNDLGGKTPLKSILDHRTHFWVGSKFGFGFYTAGEIRDAFVFDAEGTAVRTVEIPDIKGQMIDSTCCFSSERCWFICSIKEQAQVINRCTVMRPDGSIVAMASAISGDGSWLGTVRGKVPTKKGLFSATDEGLVMVGTESGHIAELAQYPDTEPFVDETKHLFPGPGGGIHVVGKQEVVLITIAV